MCDGGANPAREWEAGSTRGDCAPRADVGSRRTLISRTVARINESASRSAATLLPRIAAMNASRWHAFRGKTLHPEPFAGLFASSSVGALAAARRRSRRAMLRHLARRAPRALAQPSVAASRPASEVAAESRARVGAYLRRVAAPPDAAGAAAWTRAPRPAPRGNQRRHLGSPSAVPAVALDEPDEDDLEDASVPASASTSGRADAFSPPAILVCTSKVVDASARGDYEAWLAEGKLLIADALGDDSRRFSWVHFPGGGGGVGGGVGVGVGVGVGAGAVVGTPSSRSLRPETVAVVFQRRDDLERWRRSASRAEWLARGERFNGADVGSGDKAKTMVTARASSIGVNDGSLGGWLPAEPISLIAETRTEPEETASKHSSSIPAWKVYAAVVLAQYPLYEVNALLILPGLDAANVAAWAALPQPAKGMLVQAWTSIAAVFGTLPATQRLLRAYGFFRGGGSEKAKTVIATALTAGTFGVAVAGGLAVEPAAGTAVSALAEVLGGGA